MRVRQISTDGPELARVARLRYAVYVEEAGIRLLEADHARRTIREPLDDWATHFVAEDAAGEILGSIRVNHAGRGDLGWLIDRLGMREFGSYFPSRSAFVSRLMVLPGHRRRRLPWALLEAAFSLQVSECVAFSFAECRPERRAWCLGCLGYVQAFPDFQHPTDGMHHPLVLPLEDAEHLAAVGSPLRRLVREAGASVEFFRERFGAAVQRYSRSFSYVQPLQEVL